MPVGPLDAFWHLLNFFAPALGIGLGLPLLAKLIWHRELKAVPWRHLARWTTGLAALAWVVALLLFGKDGRMASYGVLVAASALSLWWVGFVARPR